MTLGKRLSTEEPLTEHDVAERLDKAALRTLRILMDVRQTEGLWGAVRTSRYHTNVLTLLAEELALWTGGNGDEQGHDQAEHPRP